MASQAQRPEAETPREGSILQCNPHTLNTITGCSSEATTTITRNQTPVFLTVVNPVAHVVEDGAVNAPIKVEDLS